MQNSKLSEITFFHSKKYEVQAKDTKASFCITTKHLSHLLPSNCMAIIVDNVLIVTAQITKTFYPNSVTDDFDPNVKLISKTSFSKISSSKHSSGVWRDRTYR